MNLLKTYSISADITSGLCYPAGLDGEIKTSGHITGYQSIEVEGDVLKIYGTSFANEGGCDAVVLAHAGVVVLTPEAKEFVLDFALNGIYGNTSTSYSYIPIEVLMPLLSTIGANYTKLEVKVLVSYNTTGASTADIELYNYTDSSSIAGTETSLPNATWSYSDTAWIDITSSVGKAIRLGTKRVGGTGSDSIQIEAVSLLIKYS